MTNSESERLRAAALQGVTVREMRCDLAGVSTAIVEAGDGPPLVLLHGPGEHAAKWRSVLPDLARTHRVIAPDLPGHGESRADARLLGAAETIDWLRQVVARTCAEPPTVIGHALGGALAARFAIEHPDRLAALVLVDSLGLVAFEPRPEFGVALGAFLQQPTAATHDALWRRCAFDLDRMTARLGAAWPRLAAYNLDRARDASLRTQQQRLMEDFGLPAIPAGELARIRVPTLLIHGRDDLATPVAVAEAASSRFAWPLHVVDRTGDDPPLENPRAFLAQLRPFLVRATRVAWDTIAPAYDRTNTPTQMWIAGEGLQRAGVGEGTRFLDVASGSGALAIPAARRGARVTAVDLSPVMLDLLRERARRERLDIATAVMDGHALDLEDASFDVVGSQFGVMLMPDLPRAIGEMARVVVPAGRVLLTVYGDPARIDFLALFVAAVQSVRPGFTGPPGDPPPDEFRLSDARRLRREITAAGLHDAGIETIDEGTEFADGAALWDWILGSNPIVEHMLAALSITAGERAAIERALGERVRERAAGRGTARLRNPVHVAVATR